MSPRVIGQSNYGSLVVVQSDGRVSWSDASQGTWEFTGLEIDEWLESIFRESELMLKDLEQDEASQVVKSAAFSEDRPHWIRDFVSGTLRPSHWKWRQNRPKPQVTEK
jgi:hypothetical protein